VIYRRALALEEATVNPTTRLDLPAVEGTRDRFATPEEAATLIAGSPRASGRFGRRRSMPGCAAASSSRCTSSTSTSERT
jgi:hypothetical protein